MGPTSMGLFMVLGYLKANYKKFQDIDTITGSSGGAVIGLFLAMGWHPDRIMDALLSVDPKICEYSVRSLIMRYGMVKLDKFKKALEKLIGGSPTFNEVDLTLYITAFSLTMGKTIYFSKHTHPDMPIIDAVMASIAIPFIMEPSRYKDDVYIDGGFEELYPSESAFNWNPDDCFLIRLKFESPELAEITNIVSFLKAFIDRSIQKLRPFNPPHYKYISLDCIGYNVMDFKMDYETKLRMFMDGTIF